jgi:DNA replication protein DnaC
MSTTEHKMQERLTQLLRELRLPAIRHGYQEASRQARSNTMSYEAFLLALCEAEHQERLDNRIERYTRQSGLPREKTLAALDLERMGHKTAVQLRTLLEGDFLQRRENVLAFGNPGSGKTHLLCAIGHELIQAGRRIYFTQCSMLVQHLLRAKRDLRLERALKTLSRYEAIIIDDIGYIQQDRDEMEVLFALFAHRYERGSILLSSNLPFSQWERIFKDPMTTAAAIDRIIHHSVIFELNLPSYRMHQAQQHSAWETEASDINTS